MSPFALKLAVKDCRVSVTESRNARSVLIDLFCHIQVVSSLVSLAVHILTVDSPGHPFQQTNTGSLCFYGIHRTREAVLSLPGGFGKELHKIEVFLKTRVVAEDARQALSLYGNSTAVVIGWDDSSVTAYSWHGKVCQGIPLSQRHWHFA